MSIPFLNKKKKTNDIELVTMLLKLERDFQDLKQQLKTEEVSLRSESDSSGLNQLTAEIDAKMDSLMSMLTTRLEDKHLSLIEKEKQIRNWPFR